MWDGATCKVLEAM